MPPKRKATRASTQSTLAFHGASNKVTKSGAKTAQGKKNIIEGPTAKPKKTEVVRTESAEEAEHTDGDSTLASEPEQRAVVAQAPSTPEEDAARKITEREIKKYWDAKEKMRKAPRVHQKELSLHDKVLIEFDMSGHYGPCVGISRTRRWKRAHKLRLNPPIEVLAVLLKKQDKDDHHERSRVDELLNSNNAELGVDA